MNKKSSGSRSREQRLTAVGTRYADQVTPLYPQKLALTSPTDGGRSVGIVRSRTKATEFRFYSCKYLLAWCQMGQCQELSLSVKASVSFRVIHIFLLKGPMSWSNHCGNTKFHWAKVITTLSYAHLVKQAQCKHYL